MSEEISINVKGPNELKVQVTIALDKTVLELKEAIAEKTDVPADRQRLIYSGRVLKDEDQLSTYKIQTSHTIHMVKGAARNPDPPAAQPLPTMQTGQNPSDPLTILNGPAGHGLMAGFNPFAQMGVNPNDPNMMQTMFDSPQFQQQMNEMLSNPAILDMIIDSNPQLRAMGPEVRQMFQSEQFRQMVTNPQMMRNMMEMQRAMGGGAGGGLFGPSNNQPPPGGNLFNQPLPPPAPGSLFAPFAPFGQPPAAGATGATPTAGATGTTPAGAAPGSPPADAGAPAPLPFAWGLPSGAAAPGGAGAGAAGQGLFGNPYASLFMPPAAGGSNPWAGAGAGPGGLYNPAAGGLFNPAPPADSRPPEERYETQLAQLQGMGFTNAQQNIRALMATGGNVNAAVEYILGGGGLM